MLYYDGCSTVIQEYPEKEYVHTLVIRNRGINNNLLKGFVGLSAIYSHESPMWIPDLLYITAIKTCADTKLEVNRIAEIIKRFPVLEEIHLNSYPFGISLKPICTAIANSKTIRIVNISSQWSRSHTDIIKSVICNPNIKSFGTNLCSGSDAAEFIPHLTHIRELRIRNADYSYNHLMVNLAMQGYLQCLHISCIDMENFKNVMEKTNVEIFFVERCVWTDWCMEDYISKVINDRKMVCVKVNGICYRSLRSISLDTHPIQFKMSYTDVIITIKNSVSIS